jgi:hypothetical protein
MMGHVSWHPLSLLRHNPLRVLTQSNLFSTAVPPCPYNLDIEMAIIAKNQDDGLANY